MNVVGHPVCPRHTLTVAGKPMTGSVPAIVVNVFQGARQFRQFKRLCDSLSLGLVVDADGASVCGEGFWEVVGPLASLARVAQHPSVRSWHPVMSAPTFARGPGSGAEKYVPRPAAPDPKPGEWTTLHNKFRQLLREGEAAEAAKVLPLISTGKGNP